MLTHVSKGDSLGQITGTGAKGIRSICLTQDEAKATPPTELVVYVPQGPSVGGVGVTITTGLIATSAVHGLAVGDHVVMAGFVTETQYNKVMRVLTVPSTTTFTVADIDGDALVAAGSTELVAFAMQKVGVVFFTNALTVAAHFNQLIEFGDYVRGPDGFTGTAYVHYQGTSTSTTLPIIVAHYDGTE